jgi:hypothetical protein
MSNRIDTIAPHILVSNYDPTMTVAFNQSFGSFLMSEQPGLLAPIWAGDERESTLEYMDRAGKRRDLLTLQQTDTLGMAGTLSALGVRRDLNKSDALGVTALIDERELRGTQDGINLMQNALMGLARRQILKGLLIVPALSAEYSANWPTYDLGKGFGIFPDDQLAESNAFGAIVANHLIKNRLLTVKK